MGISNYRGSYNDTSVVDDSRLINKYMELEEQLMSEYIKTLKKLGITDNYKIHNDGSVDVDGDVDLSKMNLDEIPIKFGVVLGDFSVNRNHLTSLKNAPVIVQGSFNCMNNKLETLEHSPVYIGNDFACSRNETLQSLDEGPMLVRGDYGCGFNPQITEEQTRSKKTIVIGQTIYYNKK